MTSRFPRRVLAALVAVASCASCTAGASAAPAAPEDVDLMSALREGGLVIMFRHGATDRSLDDDEIVDFGDCTTQRVLTDQGRA
ncbi:MAG: hypothetical protein M3443_17190, partial [Actinomycetota bacterium]|nr:hypothetical protein [Actinomycetota bacterium]